MSKADSGDGCVRAVTEPAARPQLCALQTKQSFDPAHSTLNHSARCLSPTERR